jgi:hypothetical protein
MRVPNIFPIIIMHLYNLHLKIMHFLHDRLRAMADFRAFFAVGMTIVHGKPPEKILFSVKNSMCYNPVFACPVNWRVFC